MIELRGVSQTFTAPGLPPRTVLAPLDLRLSERRIGIVGSNGSGKSTLARLIGGLLLPTTGQVSVGGADTRTQTRDVRRRLGFVFQNPDHQIVFPVVEEDLAFGLRNLGLSAAQTEERLSEMLARYDLTHLRQHAAHHLSGGQKQLLALAGVLVMRPEVIVFDEPTTLLDLRNRNRVARAIAELPQQALVVTHDLDLLRDFDRVLVFEEGALLADAAPAEAIALYRARMEDA